MFPFLRFRSTRLKNCPAPPELPVIMDKNVRHYRRLSESDQEELLGRVGEFLALKNFEGCSNLVMTDEVRVTIAGQACLLLLHRTGPCFPGVMSVLVYPGEYVAPWQEIDESGIVVEGEMQRSGEAAGNGALVVSWEDVLMAGADDDGAYNVVLHEFAHQLDLECGITAPGSPLWRAVLKRGYHRLQHDAAHRRESLFDRYGAESPAEFFAVVTECFFENPVALRARQPDLYAGLAQFYRQDPATWPGWRKEERSAS
jgi:Mlc titration factor MtfA (ptsG expression regulator)